MPALTPKRAAYVLITALLTCATSVSVYAQTTRILFYPTPDGAGYTSFHAISGDGSTAVGQSGTNAIRWTESTGITPLPMLTDWRSAAASGVSRDGRVISVTGFTQASAFPYRWNGTNYEQLGGVVGPVAGYANGVSADGQTVTGFCWSLSNPGEYRAVRWNASNVASQLSVERSRAIAISRDASVIIGRADTSSGAGSFRWTMATGAVVSMNDRYQNISANGRVIVGQVGNNPAIWRDNETPILLPIVPQFNVSMGLALASNEDGSVIGGNNPQGAFLWTERTGVLSVQSILWARGIDHHLVPTSVVGISDDGTRIAATGYQYNPVNNSPSGLMIIDLPICPGDFNRDYFVDLFDYLDFVSAFAAADPAADLNSDGVVDFFDYLDFVDRFQGSC